MKLSPVLSSFLVVTGIYASVVSADKAQAASSGLRANANQDARKTNEVTPDRYWIAPIKNVGLKCIDNSIRAGGGKPNEICMTEGEALCIEYDYKPMGGRWQFGIKDSKLRLYNPKGEVVYEYCKDVTHLCIGEEHGFDPNRYSKERPYLTLYDEKIHEVVGSLTCDGTDGKNDENIGQSSILKLVDQADVGPYADYPLTLVKFRKGQTEHPKDDNSLWNITVTEPVATATGLQLESFLNYNADRCEWKSYVDSFEDLKRQIAAATASDLDNRAKIEICEDRPIVFEDIIDFSNKYFEVSCLGDGCVFDLNGYSFVTPFGVGGSPFQAEFEGMTIKNGSSRKGRDDDTYNTYYGGAFLLRGLTPDVSTLVLKDSTLRKNVAISDSGVIDSIDASVIATDCIFEYNESGDLGGVMWTNGGSTFERCHFEGNYAEEYGGALYVGEEWTATIMDCTFDDNTAGNESGGAIYFDYETDAHLERCTFKANSAKFGEGGAIYTDGGSRATITDCEFHDNAAGYDGGAISFYGNNFVLEGCIFSSNYAEIDGGAIFTDVDSRATITDCEFHDNTADSDGGAIFMFGGNNLVLEGCIFSSNSAGVDGGAIYTFERTEMHDCSFQANSAGDWGGAVIAAFENAEISHCNFEDNDAIDGGAVFIGSDSTFEHCHFKGNHADEGGAVSVYYAMSKIESSTFEGNYADKGGAVSSLSSPLHIEGTTFECNEADDEGGAVFSSRGEIEVVESEFSSNKAGSAGALYLSAVKTQISLSLFDGNKATFVGGAIAFIFAFESTINDTTFQNNTLLSATVPSDDIFNFLKFETIQCGSNSGNCFCGAQTIPSGNVTTNYFPTTCAGAGTGLTCPGCRATEPTSCSAISRAEELSSRSDVDPFENSDMMFSSLEDMATFKGNAEVPTVMMTQKMMEMEAKMDEKLDKMNALQDMMSQKKIEMEGKMDNRLDEKNAKRLQKLGKR